MSSTSSTTPDQPTNDPVAAAADAALVPMSAAGEVMTVLVVVLFLLFVIALVLYLRTKHCPGTLGYSRRARRGPLPFAPGSASPLEPSVLGSLPVTSVRLRGFVEPESGLDQCAVCLSEFGEGEKARLLPKCGHGFHVDCIDMWFASNSTCPLCRLPVVDVPRACRDASSGSSDEGSSSTARCSPPEKREKGIVLVIDVPERSWPLAPLAELEGQIGIGGVEKRGN